MKKKLEAELISLAHRILQLKNKSEIGVLHEEARKLYEKLSVLRFVEENFADAKPTIGQAEIEDKLGKAFDYDKKVIVGKVEAEEETDVPAANEISAMVENLAASKTVTGEPAQAETEEKEEPEAEAPEETQETETASREAGSETPQEEREHEESEEQTAGETQPQEAKTAGAPTFEQGAQFEQPEAVEEIKLAEEANKAEEFFWEAKPAEVPAAEVNTEAPENSGQDDLFAPKFELAFDAKEDDIKKQDEPSPTFTFDDLLGKDYADPVFVKREDFDKPAAPAAHDDEPRAEEPKKEVIPITRSFDTSNVIPINKDENRAVSLNERLSKGITIGLNDRIAFMKNLFNNSSEDYNRVLSQLITFDTYGDAKNFIDNMVKPDYNNWEGKEEYEQRFMEIVEKRFS